MDATHMECEMAENSATFKQNINDVSTIFHHSSVKQEQSLNLVDSSGLDGSVVAILNDRGREGISVTSVSLSEQQTGTHYPSINRIPINSLPLISELEKGRNSSSNDFSGPLHQNFPAVAESMVFDSGDMRAQQDCPVVDLNLEKETNSLSVSSYDNNALESASAAIVNMTSSSNNNILHSLRRDNKNVEIEGPHSLEFSSLKMIGEDSVTENNGQPMSTSRSCDSIEKIPNAINHRMEPANSSTVKDLGTTDSGDVCEFYEAVNDEITRKDNNNTELTQTEGRSSQDKSWKIKVDNSQISNQQIPPIHFVSEAVGIRSTRQSRASLLHRACKSTKKPKPDIQGIGIKEFNCGVCKQTFAQRLLLKKHIAERHEGKSNLSEDRDRSLNDVIFICPICKVTFTRKHGLKRHFSNKHSSVKSICCPACKHIARNLQEYLNHAVIHTLVVTAESPHFRVHKVAGAQLKCRECHRAFQTNDTLRLHVLNHNVIEALSQSQAVPSHPPSLRNDTSKNTQILNSDKTSESVNGDAQLSQTVLSHLSEELKSTVEQSLDTASKVISRLDVLTCSIRSESSSVPMIEKFFPALNFISSLSTGLSSLSSTLGQILLTESLMNVKVEDDERINYNVLSKPVSQSHDDEECERESFPDGHAICKEEPITAEEEDEVKENYHSDDGDKMNVALSQSKKKKRPKRGRRKLNSPRKVCKTKEPHDHICPQCGKVFKNCVNLKRHNLIHQDQRPYKCKLCKLAFRRSHHLKRHMLTHAGKRPFKCDSCDFTAKSAKTLHTHSVLHGQDQSFPCEKCDFVGRTVYELSRHEKKHNPCPLCNYISADAADFNMHKRSHLNFTCTDCNYSCYSSWQLRRHARKHNPPSKDQQKYCCELCGYSCIEKRHFDYHMARHENRTPYSCPDCDYKCSSRTSFDAHKLMHAGLKPFLCSICGASFRRTSYLNNHMLIHKDEKKHVCRTCGHPFRSRYNLKVHEMTHTGEKQFKCHLCEFACRRNKELRLHLERHRSLGQIDEDVKPSLPEDVKVEDVTISS